MASADFLWPARPKHPAGYNSPDPAAPPEHLLTIHRFQLQGEFIELNVLLKLLGLAPSGGSAKNMIAAGAVTVDGETETRTRRKLRPGQTVRLADDEIRVVATDAAE